MNGYKQDTMQGLIGERTASIDLCLEPTLPDYMPEIRKLLRVQIAVSPPDCFVGSVGAELSGNAEFRVLYVGEDGMLYTTEPSGDYAFSIPISFPTEFDPGEGILCDADVGADMISGRVTAPRKLSLRCRLTANLRLFGTRRIGADGAEGENVERLTGEFPTAKYFLGRSDNVLLSDEIFTDGQDSLRVISSDGRVFVKEATAGSGAISARGEVCLKLLVCKDESGELPDAILRRIPFSAEIPMEGVEVNCEVCAHGDCPAVRVTVGEGKLDVELDVRLYAQAQRNDLLTVVRDAYAIGQESEATYDSLKLCRALKCLGGNFSVNTSLAFSEVGVPANAVPVDLVGEARINTVEAERGKVKICGFCRFSAVMKTVENEYTSHDFEVPFRYEAEGSRERPDLSPDVFNLHPTLLSCRARADGERLNVDAELAVSGRLGAQESLPVLKSLKTGSPLKDAPGKCVICFPAPGETLWSVSGRYHVPVQSLTEKNTLPSSPSADAKDSLAGVGYLVI